MCSLVFAHHATLDLLIVCHRMVVQCALVFLAIMMISSILLASNVTSPATFASNPVQFMLALNATIPQCTDKWSNLESSRCASASMDITKHNNLTAMLVSHNVRLVLAQHPTACFAKV